MAEVMSGSWVVVEGVLRNFSEFSHILVQELRMVPQKLEESVDPAKGAGEGMAGVGERSAEPFSLVEKGEEERSYGVVGYVSGSSEGRLLARFDSIEEAQKFYFELVEQLVGRGRGSFGVDSGTVSEVGEVQKMLVQLAGEGRKALEWSIRFSEKVMPMLLEAAGRKSA